MKKSIRLSARGFAPALSVLSLAVAASVQAQALEGAKTMQMVVTASRVPTATRDTLGDVSVMNRAEIEASGATSFPELLALIPGVQITPSSVRGETASIFVRGANTNQTLFLIDGQRVSSATTGATAFVHVPLEQIDRIEILRGPSSSLYGSDAIGGVIQVFTKQGGNQKPVTNFYGGIGQYGTQIASVGYGGRVEGTTFHAQMGYEDSKGFSQIKSAKSGMFDAYNADRDGYRQSNLGLNVKQELTSSVTLSGHYLYSNGLRHTDNANCDASWTSCTSNFDNHDTQTLETTGVALGMLVTPAWKTNVRLGRTTDKLESLEFDPTTAVITVPKYKTTQDQFSWQNDFDVNFGKLLTVVEWRGVNVDSTKSLDQTKQNTSSVALAYQGSQGKHLYQTSLRRDEISGIDGQNTGNVGYGYRLQEGLVIRGQVGTAFHAPTFNDLYWPLDPVNFFQGNPNLKPEKSLNREIGLNYEGESSSLGLTFYKNQVTNLIAYYSDPLTYMGTMNNIGTADLKGATLHYKKTIGNWGVKTSYDVLSARDRGTDHMLARRAPHFGFVEVDRKAGPIRTAVRVDAVSKRFNNSTNTQELSGYALLSLRASYMVRARLQVEASLSNALNRDYVTQVGTVSPYNEYTMPGRSLYLGVRYTSE